MSPNNKLSIAAALALSAVGTGCNAIAEKLAGDEPIMPTLGVIKRKPIQLSISIDVTRSAIRDQLPDVIRVTSEVLGTEGVLEDGDAVNFCRIGGKGSGATCEQYSLNDERGDLMDALQGTEASGMSTWVRPALDTMFGASPDGEHRIAVVWSDFIEEAEGPERVRAPFPVHFLVPDSRYREAAEQMCGKVDGQCDVRIVTNGGEFARTLRTYTDALTASAQGEAEARASEALAESMSVYQAQKAAYAAKLKSIRNWTVGGISAVLASLAAAALGLAAYWKRPQLRGVLIDVRGKYDERLSINNKGRQLDLSTLGFKKGRVEGTLKATKHGLVLNGGQAIISRHEIAPGIYFLPPQDAISPREVTTLHEAYKKNNTQ